MSENKKILMIDDDVEDRMLLKDMFAEIGFPNIAHYEHSVDTAMSYLEKLSSEELPSLIVLDLNMPKVSGTQVLRDLKENDKLKDISVIIYSTCENRLEKEQTLKLGAHSYVIKPGSYDECVEKARYFNQLSVQLDKQ
jgi:CheY-like chemotaxis protein